MENKNVDVEKLKAASDKIGTITKVLQLELDLINFVPGPERLNKDELLMKYHFLDKALSNIFELNQGLISDLDNLCATIDEEIESIESIKNLAD